jgi:uncharacterized membrane protein YbaN (DUF454 family)
MDAMHCRPRATGLKRIALLAGGFMSVALGVLGAILPLMPAVPFFLLAAYCFARSSQRCHTWLTQNRLFGRYVAHAAHGGALSLRTRLALAGSCVVSAAVSAAFLAPNLTVAAVSVSVATVMSGYLLLRRPRKQQVVRTEVMNVPPGAGAPAIGAKHEQGL